MKAPPSAPAQPPDDDILAAIDKMTIVELRDLSRHLDDIQIARGVHIHAYTHDDYVGWVCRCGDKASDLLY